jgi:tol-pal system protein YbgF
MRRFWVLAIVAAAPVYLFGCARSAEERQLDEMRSALKGVDEDQPFGDKLTDKELSDMVRDRPSRARPYGPQPRVVRLDDGSEQASADYTQTAGYEAADDPGARPVIRVRGAGRSRQTVEETIPDESAAQQPTDRTPRPSALNPEARKAYESALALVNSKHYAQALDAFAAFLLKYPDHPYVVNAMYWRGECYYAQGDYVRAAEQFEGVVARFPLGGKTPDALLKLGLCQLKLGNPPKAQTYFDKLSSEWPRSDAARRIPSSSTRGAQGSGHQVKP